MHGPSLLRDSMGAGPRFERLRDKRIKELQEVSNASGHLKACFCRPGCRSAMPTWRWKPKEERLLFGSGSSGELSEEEVRRGAEGDAFEALLALIFLGQSTSTGAEREGVGDPSRCGQEEAGEGFGLCAWRTDTMCRAT